MKTGKKAETRPRLSSAVRSVATVVVIVMLVAACGDSTDSGQGADSAEPGTTTTTSEPEKTTITTRQTTTTEEEVQESAADSEFCLLISEDQEVSEQLDYSDPEQLEEGFTESLQRMEEAARLAPDDIQGDVELIVERFRDFSAALEDAGWDLFSVSNTDVRVAAMEQPDMLEALNRVSDECGLAETVGGETDDSGDVPAASGDIPEVLLPPQAGEVLAETPLFTITTSATYDELVSHYTDVFGSMTSESEEQATFIGQVEGAQTAVWVIRDPDRGVIVTISQTP